MSKLPYNADFSYVDSGAFKSVEIYDHYVRKMAKEEDNYSYKLSYSEAQEHSCYFDSNNEFHFSWVQTEYENGSGPSYGECTWELEKEFNYANRKKHLPIIVPILEGYDDCYVMPRAKTYQDFETDRIPQRVLKRREKEIKISLMARIQKAGGKILYEDVAFRVDSLIKLGIAAKLSNRRIVSNLYWFVVEDVYSNLLSDMHRHNIGIYHGNLVTFDMGQTERQDKISIRKHFEERDVSSIRWRHMRTR